MWLKPSGTSRRGVRERDAETSYGALLDNIGIWSFNCEYKLLEISEQKSDSLKSLLWLFPRWHSDKESACNAGDTDSIPGSGGPPGERHGNPFQYLAWKIPWTKETGRLQSIGSQSWTQLSMHALAAA